MSRIVQRPGIGDGGQTWQNVTASRLVNTVYTNTTGRAIFVSIIVSGTATGRLDISSSGISQTTPVSGGVGWTGAIVPAGGSYSFGLGTVASWFELRS